MTSVDEVLRVWSRHPFDADTLAGALFKLIRHRHLLADPEARMVRWLLARGADPNRFVLQEAPVSLLAIFLDSFRLGHEALRLRVLRLLLEAGARFLAPWDADEWLPAVLHAPLRAQDLLVAHRAACMRELEAEVGVALHGLSHFPTIYAHGFEREGPARVVATLVGLGADPRDRTDDGRLPSETLRAWMAEHREHVTPFIAELERHLRAHERRALAATGL